MLRKLLLVFIFVFSTLALLAQTESNPPLQLTIEAIASGSMTGHLPESLQWSPDGSRVTYILRDDNGEHGELWSVDPASAQKTILLTETKLASLAPPASKLSNERAREWHLRYGVSGYHWSPDSKYLLFDSNGQFWLYSLQTGTGVEVTASPDPSSDPKFSPDGKNIAFIRKHDLWVRGIPDGTERQLTKGGVDDLLNGEVDWVYEEELDVRSNYFWSPDGKQIAFLQMDEKKVPEYPIVDYSSVHAKADNQKYPNPGDPNPDVRVGVLDAGSGHARWITLPDMKNGYVPRFGWLKAGVLWIEVLNRAQNKMVVYFADASRGDARMVLTETSDAWVGEREEIYWFKSGDRLLLPSWRDGHTHLYLFSWDKDHPLSGETKLVAQVTKGDFEVSKINYVDENAGIVYFTADPNDPRQRQVFSVKLDASEMKQVSEEQGTHDAVFGSKPQFYVDRYSSLMKPPVLSMCNPSGKCSPFWQSKEISSLHLTPPQQLKVKAADGTTTLYAELFMPLGTMDTSVRYPVLLHPYGGPSGQSVRDEWGGGGFLFAEYLARRGFGVLVVDNRGMAGRGKQFNAWLKKKFGEIELADQLAALDQVTKRIPMLDPKKIGWFGASYGGYMTLYAMTHSDRIGAGVSIAPVSDWRLYDSIYTERYLGTPQENEEGYKLSSPTNDAAKLHGALVIAHGTSDDNVHVQNTISMTQAVIKAGKQLNIMLYPGKTHGISGPDATANLFHLIEDHFTRQLKTVPMDGGQTQ
ncbi:MAG: alpha/beta fold hydrolase [Terriglobales bacterium]